MLVNETDAKQARWGSRHEDVAKQAQHVREQDRVAEAIEVLMAARVDPQHRQAKDGELRVPVRPRHKVSEPRALVDEVLEGQLIKFVRVVRFERNDAEPVLERALRMLAGDAAGELVRDQKREPDTDLTEKIAPTTR